MIRSFVVALILLFFSVLLETLLFSNIAVLPVPVIPDVALIVLVFFSVHNGVLFGEITGFASGLMLDFLTAGPFGLNCMIRTIIGFGFGFFKNALNTKVFFVRILIGFSVTVVKAAFISFLAFIFPNGNIVTYGFFSLRFVVELGLNMVAAPIIFALLELCRPFLVISQMEGEG
jgi:rod shape-determining protein MreD